MPAILPPAPVNPTGQLAQSMPGYDPVPAIAAQEQSLQDFLNLPVREILARLGLPPSANGKPPEGEPKPEEPRPEDAQQQGNPIDPMSLISPVTDALSTLGPGLFQGVDPTAMFQGISQAFQSTGTSLQPALGAVDNAWQGASGTAAATKTTTAMANGTEVALQSDALRSSLETAATNVAQARVRLIEIITEFQATLAAIGPSIIFPWGWAAAIAAANKAIASTAEVMTELQSSLAAQAAEVTAAGAPVEVTPSPQTPAPTGGASPLGGLASPLMSMATKGAQAGIQAGTGAASSASQAANQAAGETAARTTGAAMAPVGGAVPPTGGGGGAGGGGAGGAAVPRSVAMSSMVQPETGASSPQSATVRASGGAAGVGGAGMMGAPMAPMAGHGGNASSNSHSAASFLHTTDQGGEIVGDLGNAAPPVLGEADPNEPPDVELRI
jgi:hypothetical protein